MAISSDSTDINQLQTELEGKLKTVENPYKLSALVHNALAKLMMSSTIVNDLMQTIEPYAMHVKDIYRRLRDGWRWEELLFWGINEASTLNIKDGEIKSKLDKLYAVLSRINGDQL